LEEINAELHYRLARTDEPFEHLTGGFERNLPKRVAALAERWIVRSG